MWVKDINRSSFSYFVIPGRYAARSNTRYGNVGAAGLDEIYEAAKMQTRLTGWKRFLCGKPASNRRVQCCGSRAAKFHEWFKNPDYRQELCDCPFEYCPSTVTIPWWSCRACTTFVRPTIRR